MKINEIICEDLAALKDIVSRTIGGGFSPDDMGWSLSGMPDKPTEPTAPTGVADAGGDNESSGGKVVVV